MRAAWGAGPLLRHTARVKALLAFFHEALTAERDLFEGKRIQRTKSSRGGKSVPLLELT